MTFDGTLSLDIILTLLGIIIAVWQLNSRNEKMIGQLREELKGDISGLKDEISDLKDSQDNLRTELKGEISDLKDSQDKLRTELKGEISDLKDSQDKLRTELKGEISDLKAGQENLRTELRGDLRRVEDKVDDSNQRLARLEGRFEGREERLAAESETDTAA